MANNRNIKNLIELNIATIILGTSGPLGRIIGMPPPFTIWARCFLGAIALYLITRILKNSLKVDWKKHWHFFIISGALMGLHWVLYFYALKLSNVALAHISIFTFPVITTLLEPVILKSRFNYFNFIAAILVFIGIIIMVPEFNLANDHTLGIVVGVISAIIFSVRNIMNKQYIQIYSGMTIMLYQLVVISILLAPTTAYLSTFTLGLQDYWGILTLGVLTTAIGHTMFTHSFKHFTVSTASIINSLTPIYGIIIAYLFLNEVPVWNTLVGGGIIILTVLIENIKSYRS